ncbi:LON peptidase substrate-binding domain-containing protein [Aquimarina sp. 2201CG5-10]|uniref:LON peptidase substrate-binding domain-containing protein n=1 Tax=Aquimarina callyspongiae TaxID=3098150 RepID=UPI002AB3467A|nr:LON peptidase substrate-binding domain-containing protein [Aquimarina sp. 2201CG5-10]MDY8134043.1 LON peptidase substrate-binding domain-containing protein [Aquimarina sp. 2201CG5-10]
MFPLFPLQIVVYPGERLPLHIFEKRYQQLIKDCEENKISFGIPTYINEKLEYGTEVTLQKIAKRYSGGESDVICTGKRIFRIKSFYKKFPGRLYSGGEVEFLEDDNNGEEELQEELLRNIAILYVELTIDNPPIFDIPFISYQVAHKIGLALHQEYHLLTLRSELERLNYLIGHLKITIPVVREMNRAKEVIKMNGHFKNFDPLDFDDFKL